MHKRGELEFLKDIVEAIERVEFYTNDRDYEEFLQDIRTQDAVVRNIEIVGEASKNIPSNIKRKYQNVEWKELAGIRDKIVHFYFGIRWTIVWSVVKDKLPALKEKINVIIKDLEKNDS